MVAPPARRGKSPGAFQISSRSSPCCLREYGIAPSAPGVKARSLLDRSSAYTIVTKFELVDALLLGYQPNPHLSRLDSDFYTVIERVNKVLTKKPPKRMTAGRILEARHGHWGVENKLHWVLDMQFRENGSRAGTGNSADNLNVLCHCLMMLSLIKSSLPLSAHHLFTRSITVGEGHMLLDNRPIRVYTAVSVIGGDAPAGGAGPDKMAG